MRFEKNTQFVAALYDATRDDGTKIEPLFDHIPVLENAFDFDKVHTVEFVKYIFVRLEQL